MNQSQSNHQEHTPKPEGAFDSLSAKRETLPQSSQMLSAWTDDHLTQHQREWIRNEHELLREYMQAGDVVCDFGCGDCRILRSIKDSPYIRYVGLDIDPASIEAASKEYPSTSNKTHRFIHGDGSEKIRGLPFLESEEEKRIVTICIGNTLGSFGEGRVEALRSMLEVSAAVILSVCENSPDIMLKRLEYYQQNNLVTHVKDWRSGSIFSDMWGESKSFTADTLLELAKESGTEELGITPKIVKIPPLGIAMILERPEQ